MHGVHRGGQGLRGTLRSMKTGDTFPLPSIIMLFFAYGTLTEPIVRDRVLGHTVETSDAVLDGYVKVCGWDYLTLVPGDGSVKGVVFEADDGDVRRMDVWEDVPVYVPIQVDVSVDGSMVAAFCYIMPEPPERYEVVEDSRIAAIPLGDIIRDVGSMFGRLSDDR